MRARKLAQRKIRHDLHQIEDGEENDRGADQRELVEALRQHVDLKRRRADLDEGRSEAGQRAPDHAHGRMRPLRFRRRTPEIGAPPGAKPRMQHEDERDRADRQLDRGIGEIAREQPSRRRRRTPSRAAALSDSKRSRRGDRSTPKWRPGRSGSATGWPRLRAAARPAPAAVSRSCRARQSRPWPSPSKVTAGMARR